MLVQDRPDDLPLHADPAAVDDPDLAKTSLHCLKQVFLNDDFNFLWLEGVQIDRVFDRKLMHVNKSG